MAICAFERLDDPDLSGFFPQRALLDDCDYYRSELFPVLSWMIDERLNPYQAAILVEEYCASEEALKNWRKSEKRQRAADRLRRNRRLRATEKRSKATIETKKALLVAELKLVPRVNDQRLVLVNRSKGKQILSALSRLGYVRSSCGHFQQSNFRHRVRSICFFDHTEKPARMWMCVTFS